MVSKTRDRFIEVARQLFARKGVENTTMNDIAEASDKGRRTIYTYFKSKHEIFNAVVESESDKVIKRLQVIASEPVSAHERLKQYILTRFEAVKEVVKRNGSLRARFFMDIRKVDRARRKISKREIVLLREILQDGVDAGEFKLKDVTRAAIIMTQTIYGLDKTYISDRLADRGITPEMMAEEFTQILLFGIIRR